MSFLCCTISVSEGNYDVLRRASSTLRLIFLICCTISVSEGNYDSPYTEAIQAASFKLHYFRFWRELRPGQSGLIFLYRLKLAGCTISVSEGNYDGAANIIFATPHTGCTISVSEGNYDFKHKVFLHFTIRLQFVALFPFLKGITTNALSGFNYGHPIVGCVALFPFLKGITTF